METFAYPCAALLSDGSTAGNRSAGQAVGEPSAGFADAVASASIEADVPRDDKAVEDTIITCAAPAGPVGWEPQAPPIPPRNPSSSALHVVSQEDHSSPNGGPAGVKGRGDAAFPSQVANAAGAGTAKAGGTDAGGRTPQKTYKHGKADGGAAQIDQAGRWGVGRKEAVGVAKQLAENGQHVPSGDKTAARDHGGGVPSAAQPLRNVRPAVARGQPRASSPRDGGPSRQEAKMAIVQSNAKESRSAGHKGKGGAQPESPASSMGQSGAVTWRPPVEAQVRGFAQVGSDRTESPLGNPGEQILDSLRASLAQGQRQVTIRLQPPELGMIVVRFREQGEHLDGLLEVARAETRHQIEQALPEVVRSLQDAGVTIRRLDVINGEPPGQELGSGSSQPDGWSGQYGSDRDRDHLPASPTTRPQPAGDYSTKSQETPIANRQKMAAHGRIDVLL